jgi:hypothetical protein
MQAIKGKTSHHLLMDHRKRRAEYWGSAPVESRLLRVQQRPTDEVIAQYIKLQGAAPDDEDRFRVSET